MQAITGIKLESGVVEILSSGSERPVSTVAQLPASSITMDQVCILSSLICKRAAMTPTRGGAVSIRLNDKNQAPVSTGHLDIAFSVSQSLSP